MVVAFCDAFKEMARSSRTQKMLTVWRGCKLKVEEDNSSFSPDAAFGPVLRKPVNGIIIMKVNMAITESEISWTNEDINAMREMHVYFSRPVLSQFKLTWKSTATRNSSTILRRIQSDWWVFVLMFSVFVSLSIHWLVDCYWSHWVSERTVGRIINRMNSRLIDRLLVCWFMDQINLPLIDWIRIEILFGLYITVISMRSWTRIWTRFCASLPVTVQRTKFFGRRGASDVLAWIHVWCEGLHLGSSRREGRTVNFVQ